MIWASSYVPDIWCRVRTLADRSVFSTKTVIGYLCHILYMTSYVTYDMWFLAHGPCDMVIQTEIRRLSGSEIYSLFLGSNDFSVSMNRLLSQFNLISNRFGLFIIVANKSPSTIHKIQSNLYEKDNYFIQITLQSRCVQATTFWIHKTFTKCWELIDHVGNRDKNNHTKNLWAIT